MSSSLQQKSKVQIIFFLSSLFHAATALIVIAPSTLLLLAETA